MSPDADPVVVEFLIRAAREFRRGGWVFTGFHWPVLAGQLAHGLDGEPFTQIFEAGAATHGAGRLVPTSTTDYAAYGNAIGFCGDTAGVLLSMARRFDRVILDASNIDIAGNVNSSMIGPAHQPRVRLPGGGGAPDIAAAARELVWLAGGDDLRRFQRRVDHVTAAPGRHTTVRMLTRWGVVVLGDEPVITEVADIDGADTFVTHMENLGARNAPTATRAVSSAHERAAAVEVLTAAAERGYQVARRALTVRGAS